VTSVSVGISRPRASGRSWRHDGLWLAAIVFSCMFAAAGLRRWNTLDAHAYWAAWQHPFYDRPAGAPDAYLYSPAFAQTLWPFTHLPWAVFLTLWMAVLTAATLWLIRPLGQWAAPVFLACVPAIITGNIYPLLAIVVVTGMRHSGAWALPILTKITPGVGLVWFAVRRDWRKLGITLAVTAAIVVVSAAIMPGAWADWFTFLTQQSRAVHGTGNSRSGLPAPPLALRLPVAVAVVGFASKTNRRWLLPVGMLLADPMFNWFAFLLLTAIPRLRRDGALTHA